MDKAYKILAAKRGLSHREAKRLLDCGMVSAGGKIIRASDIIAPNVPLRVIETESVKIIFENNDILALNKPPFLESYELERKFRGWNLLHRLDLRTSGVILLIKQNSEFHLRAIEEFRAQRVQKEYLALVRGIVAQEETINKPISTLKGHMARSKIDKNGAQAITHIEPLQIFGKKTLLKIRIKTGRTHQIRLHLSAINHPIIGENIYAKISFTRLMLHAHKIALMGHEFCANEGSFWKYLHE